MLNIISKSLVAGGVNGPQKVVANFIKGLDLLGYPYVVNKRLDSCQRLWIHDDTLALKKMQSLPSSIKVLFGPNLFILPSDISEDYNLTKGVFLHPSKWIRSFWQDFGYKATPIEIWPAGIDTDEFLPSSREKDIVLIYFKQRLPEELEYTEQILNQKNIKYEKVVYREYKEADYKEYLSRARYVIWLGRHESQGIALEEAMSCNVPILLWDVNYLGQWSPNKKEQLLFSDEQNSYKNTTSAEYFDDKCGVKIKQESDFADAIDRMELGWRDFQPRQYILDNLNLKKQARDLLELFDKYYGLDFQSGFSEKVLRDGNWINNKYYYKKFIEFKRLIKKYIKK